MQFRDEKWRQQYAENGYLQLPFLEPGELEAIQGIVGRYVDLGSEQGFGISHQALDIDSSMAMNAEINRIIEPRIRKYISDFKIFFTVVATKNNNDKSEVKFHTDRCYIDEQRCTPINLWLPLCDVDFNNGTLGVFARSQQFTYTYRGINNFEYYMAPEYYSVIERFGIKYLDVRGGEVVFYQPGLIHGSPRNMSGKPRHVLLVTLLPLDGDIIYCYQRHHWLNFFDHIDVYKADFDFWIMPDQPDPTHHLERLYRRRNKKPRLTVEQLKAFAAGQAV